MKAKLEKCKNLTYVNTSVKILSALNDESQKQLSDMANELCDICNSEACEEPVSTSKKFVCKVCGYVYEGNELPEDYRCPICGVKKNLFTEQA